MTKHLTYTFLTGKRQLDIYDQIIELRKEAVPNFIRLSPDIFIKLYEIYPDFQICVLDKKTHELVGMATSIPICWEKPLSELSDEGVTWAFNTGISKQIDIKQANILCATGVIVSEKHRNKGISKMLLQRLKDIAASKKFTSLIVPVRPTLKSAYPLIPITEYVTWKDEKGLAFDPWLKIHSALGASILKICPRSNVIKASIKQWEKWTGLSFPGSGKYIIKNALAPLTIDHTNNLGIYIEPSVWMHYPIET